MKLIFSFFVAATLSVALTEADHQKTSVDSECLLVANADKSTQNGTVTCGETAVIESEAEIISESSYSDVTAPAPKETAGHGTAFGVEQTIDISYARAIMELLKEAEDYMTNEVMVDDKYLKTRDMCVNKHDSCTFWSVLGECEANPAWMHVNCAPVCKTCEMLHIETRCPMDPDSVDALQPGDINKLFEKIAYSPEYEQFEPTVVSKPPEGPWMLVFENAISDEEAERLIELGAEQGYERSSDVGSENSDGTHKKKVNNGRTSTNAWCVGECEYDPIARRVAARIENITGIPDTNSENLQLLRYEQNQYYNVHSDYIPYQIERPCGVRILTFYMYLNDVEEGGGTRFPNVNLTVTPKRGRAALWPSVLDSDPNKKDYRTDHAALPVTKGKKFGANAWVHQRNFKTPNAIGCN